MSKTIDELAREVKRLRLVTVIVALVAVLALVLAGWALGKQPVGGGSAAPVKTVTPEDPTIEEAPEPQPTQAPIGKPADAGAVHEGTIVLGASGKGKPVVDVYEDYKCPACAQVNQFMGPQVDEVVRSGEVEVRFHPMSFLDRGEDRGGSWRAAKGAFCANEQGRFMEYHSAIWPNQQALGEHGWTLEILEDFVGQVGLDAKKWSACMADSKFDSAATQANEIALQSVQSTPTFKLNGTKLELDHVMAAGGLMAVIEANR